MSKLNTDNLKIEYKKGVVKATCKTCNKVWEVKSGVGAVLKKEILSDKCECLNKANKDV